MCEVSVVKRCESLCDCAQASTTIYISIEGRSHIRCALLRCALRCIADSLLSVNAAKKIHVYSYVSKTGKSLMSDNDDDDNTPLTTTYVEIDTSGCLFLIFVTKYCPLLDPETKLKLLAGAVAMIPGSCWRHWQVQVAVSKYQKYAHKRMPETT